MKYQTDVTNYLRDHVVGALHLGQLHSGDRLPSIREVASRLNKNTRTVKAAYRALENEGLVEVRDRSGVFVASQEVGGGEASQEMASWVSDVVAEAWKRRVSLTELPRLMQRASQTGGVRCTLVEDIEDAVVALRHELEQDWGFNVRVVAPDRISDAIDTDFFAATSFCAHLVHDAVAALGKPLVALTIHSALQEAVRSRVRDGSLTVVVADSRFGERMRIAYATNESERKHIRVVIADNAHDIANLDRNEPVLLTRAARQRLATVDVPMIFPHSPTLSVETARSLAQIAVRKNLDANRQ